MNKNTLKTLLLALIISSCSSSAKSKTDLLSTSMDLYSRDLFKTAKSSFAKYQVKNNAGAYAAFSELKIADCEFFLGEYENAITSYKNFIEQRPKNEAADYAQLQIAKAYEEIYSSEATDQSPLKNAISAYSALLTNYPESLYFKHSLESMTRIRNKLAMHEIKVAKYYSKTKNFAAAKKRLEEVVNTYAETKAAFNIAPQLAKENGIVLNREIIVPDKKLDLIKSRDLINTAKSLKDLAK